MMAAIPHLLLCLPVSPPHRLAVFPSLRFLPFRHSTISLSSFPTTGFGLAVPSPLIREPACLIATASSEEVNGEVEEEAEVMENEVLEEEEQESGTGSEERPPRKPRIKLGDIMGILHKRAIEVAEKERPVPDLRTGDIVEIKLEVPENRKRLAVYKGIIMSKQNAGIHTTIRIRRIIAGIGVEIVFPVYSPNIKEIKVVSHRKVRRARLYYLRDKLPRFSTFK